MYCKNCGNQVAEGQEICLSCGFRVTNGNNYCANCGTKVNDPGQEICLNCGHKLNNNKANGDIMADLTQASWLPAGKDKVTAIVLCFCLGGLGVHNFYLGETKKGVTRIFANILCGAGCILALIDLIRMIIDSYKVDYDAII